ncbi:RSP_7527 family protein [Pararhodobacter sp. CCB-MM2]|uniref:RSP_7527 family protein n=1 Tax=Pararhodobacter sp. CCB-MM2 TaxID=1786003 RepID=UPI00131401BB|nr:hypothetical protein [Pararhodobacter sp. CCB-MM2]MCA2010657.1 hypothetical protein [Cereibacter sphaeroides]
MTAHTDNLFEIKDLDLVQIEREARAMQARALADMFSALRRGIVSLFSRGTEARTA